MKTIKSKRDFERVYATGRRVNHRLVRMTALVGDEGDFGRVAFVAPRRLGNAVLRNRCKRLLRESARQCGLPRRGCDLILFATRQTHISDPTELARALEVVLGKAGIR